jgi:hypothetical protein
MRIRHTGGVALDVDMGCGGVSCADALLAQNQPMIGILGEYEANRGQ